MSDKVYKTTSKYDLETITRFNKFHFYNDKKKIIICILAIILIIMAIFFNAIDTSLRCIYGVVGIVWYIEYFFLPYIIAKKAYSTSPLKNAIITGQFFKDRIELSTIVDGETKGMSNLKYEDLYRVIETKTDIYLYISSRQAYCCSKENAEGTLAEFQNILKEKLNKKYVSKIK